MNKAAPAFDKTTTAADGMASKLESGVGSAFDKAQGAAGTFFSALQIVGGKALAIAADAFTFLKDSIIAGVDAFIKIGGAAVEFLTIGGAFATQKTAFDDLASSYGKSGDAIVETIQRIADNTLTMGEAMKLGTAAVSFSAKDTETSLSFIKKFSEASGKEFTGTAETMINAMKKGRFGVLTEMGIIVDKSTTLSGVFGQMGEGFKRFGDSAFDSGDKFKSISNSLEEFKTKVARAINDVPELGRVLTAAAAKAFEFVKAFDFAKITEWAAVGINAVESVGAAFFGNFNQMGAVAAGMFKSSDMNAKAFFSGVTNYAFDAFKTFAGMWNDLITVFQSLNIGNWMTGTVASAFKGIDMVVQAFTGAMDWVWNRVGKFFTEIGQTMIEFAAKNPLTAEKLGLTQLGIGMITISDGIKRTVNQADAAASAFSSGTVGKLASAFTGANSSIDGMRISIKGLDDAQKKTAAGIDAFNYTPVQRKAAEAFEGTTKALGKATDDQKKFVTRQSEDAVEAFRRIEDARLAAFGLDEEKENVAFKRKQDDIAAAFKEGLTTPAGKSLDLLTNFWVRSKEELDAFKSGFGESVNKNTYSGDSAYRRANIGRAAADAEQMMMAERSFRNQQEDAASAFKARQEEEKQALKLRIEDEIKAKKRAVEDSEESRMIAAMAAHAEAMIEYTKVAGNPLDVNLTGGDEIEDAVINRLRIRARAEGMTVAAA
jgi:hypothetical protein